METINTVTEPANAYKHLLSVGAYRLLNKLILDLKSELPPQKQIFNEKDKAGLLYNLFKGNYQFSYNQYKEILHALFN